jgi:hypothetical protein
MNVEHRDTLLGACPCCGEEACPVMVSTGALSLEVSTGALSLEVSTGALSLEVSTGALSLECCGVIQMPLSNTRAFVRVSRAPGADATL